MTSTIYTWHSTTYTSFYNVLHSALYTLHSTLCTSHFTLCTLHSAIPTSHCYISKSPPQHSIVLHYTPPHSTPHSVYRHGNGEGMHKTAKTTRSTEAIYVAEILALRTHHLEININKADWQASAQAQTAGSSPVHVAKGLTKRIEI